MNIREIYEFLSQYGLGIPERVAFNDEDPVEPANIDLRQRPTMTNPDGTVSTVGTIGAGIDGQEVLLPTVGFDSGGLGRVLSEGDAIRRYLDTGDHLGKFRTQQGAEWEADRIHNAEQARVGWMPKGGEGAGTDFDMTQDPHGGVPAMQFTQEDLMNTLNALGPMLLENATGPGQAVQSTQRLSQVDPWLAAHNLIMGRTSPVNALTGVAEGATDVLGMVPGVGPIEAGLAKGAGAMFGALGPMWTSKFRNVFAEKGPGRAVTEELSQTLGNWAKKGEFKPEELEWSGLPEWLGRKPGQKVTKQEVLDAFDEGSLKLNEVWKGNTETVPSYYLAYKNGPTFGSPYQSQDEAVREMNELFPDRVDLEVRLGEGDRASKTLSDTKFSKYQLPGGEDYREMLITMPSKPDYSGILTIEQATPYLPKDHKFTLDWDGAYLVRDNEGTVVARGNTPGNALEKLDNHPWLRTGTQGTYRSSHWDEPNPLAHVRMNTRVDADGKKVLFLEEVQSDWGQDIRKKGYKRQPTFEEFFASRENISEETARKVYEDVYGPRPTMRDTAEYSGIGDVPNSPFKKTTEWSKLAMKPIFRYAAENGYDRVAWTPGSVQFDRWGSELFSWKRDRSGKIHFLGEEQTGGNVFEGMEEQLAKEAVKRGTVVESKEDVRSIVEDVMSRQRPEWSDKNWKEHIDKITDNLWERTQTEEFGSTMPRKEGMEAYYDKILPNEVNKYVKKWGGKVGTTKIDTIPGGAREYGDFLDRQENPDFRMLPVHSVDITPSMKRDVLEKGQELFNLAPLGALTGIREDDQGRITYDPARGLAGLAGGVGAAGAMKILGRNNPKSVLKKLDPEIANVLKKYTDSLPYGDRFLRDFDWEYVNKRPTSWDKTGYEFKYKPIGGEVVEESIIPGAKYKKKYIKFQKGEGSIPLDEFKSNDDFVYRGMSLDEWIDAKKKGFISSEGKYNFSNEQGKTLWGSDIKTAYSYAGGFAPSHLAATYENPGIIVAIPKKHTSQAPDAYSNYRTTEKPIPISEVKDIYNIVPNKAKEGEIELILDKNSGDVHRGSAYEWSGYYDLFKGEPKGLQEALNALLNKQSLAGKGKIPKPSGKVPQKGLIDDLGYMAERIRKSPDDVVVPGSISSKEINRLNNEETIKVYRAMQLIDGKLYPPMSAKIQGKLREPTEFGVWQRAQENPELATEDGYFKLNKGNKKSLDVRYNPYFHTSPSPLNDQFSEAYNRPNLVTVEVEIPKSELTSGYKADRAKDAVGEMKWHSGPVSSKLPPEKQRSVILSRYAKVNRIVPDSEVADHVSTMLRDENISIPWNVVTPSLRSELEKRGVSISSDPSLLIRSTKTAPKVIETATGPRLQKDVDSDLVKMLREGLEQRTKPSEVKSETRTFNSKESVPKWNWEPGSVQKTGGSFNPLLPEEGETLAARPKRSSDVPSSVSSGEIVTKKDLDDVLTYHTKEEKLLKSPTMWVHQEDPQSPAYLIVNVNVGNKTSKPYGYEIKGSPERVRAVLDQIQDKMKGRTGNKAFRLSWPEYNPDTQPFRGMGQQQLPELDLSNLLREGLEKRKKKN